MSEKRKLFIIIVLGFSTICTVTLGIAADSFLGDRHNGDYGIRCADCHSGEETPVDKSKVSIKACIECHDGYAALIERTSESKVNPHDSHEGDISCDECHKSHKKSLDYCEQCHTYSFQVP